MIARFFIYNNTNIMIVQMIADCMVYLIYQIYFFRIIAILIQKLLLSKKIPQNGMSIIFFILVNI